MIHRPIDLGFSTADASNVELLMKGDVLNTSFINWKEESIRAIFRDVLAFKWENELDEDGLRDDLVYEVEGSEWLGRQVELQAIRDLNSYTHYKLCFNGKGVLDVLCRRTETN